MNKDNYAFPEEFTGPRVLARFDAERRTQTFPGNIREASDAIVRHINRRGTMSNILYSAHEPEEADQAIAAEIARFSAIGHDFEWKVYAHDRPPDLVERLRRAGFEIGPEEVVVVAEPDAVLAQLTESPFRVERLTDPDALDDYMAVSDQVWPDKGPSAWFADTMREAPESIGVYVAYDDGKPVGSSRCSFDRHSLFAGLWGGAVLPEYRRRGVYRSMIRRRAQDALSYGARYLQVDAAPTSRPILEKLGFQRLAVTYPCVWRSGLK